MRNLSWLHYLSSSSGSRSQCKRLLNRLVLISTQVQRARTDFFRTVACPERAENSDHQTKCLDTLGLSHTVLCDLRAASTGDEEFQKVLRESGIHSKPVREKLATLVPKMGDSWILGFALYSLSFQLSFLSTGFSKSRHRLETASCGCIHVDNDSMWYMLWRQWGSSTCGINRFIIT